MRRQSALPALAMMLALSACSSKAKSRGGAASDLTRPASEWLASEPVRLLRDYVRIDTTAENGEEEGALFLRRFFECAGIDVETVCPAPRRCNVLARLAGKRRQGAILLLHHIDVAGAFARFWKEAPPFEGRIKMGFLYGRGAYDTKSLGLAQALAIRNLKAHGIVPESDVLFLAEADEESEQRWGSRWLLAHRPEWFAGVAAVLNEGGTNEIILRDVRFWGIETLQAGYGLLELEAPMAEPLRQIAASWPKLAASAVEPDPQVVEGFGMLANHLASPLTDPLRHLDRVRKDPVELAKLPDRYASFLEPRIVWSSPYAFPPDQTEKFRSYVVVTVPPGISPDRFLGSILADAGRRGIRVVQRFSTEATAASPYPTSLTELLKRVTEARYPGIPFGPVPTSGGVSTSIYFRRRGIPAYGYSPIPINAFDAARRHGNDERIFLRDYVDGVDLFREVLAEFALDRGNKS